MGKEVSVNNLEIEFSKILKQYGDEVNDILDEEVERASKDAVKELKMISPKDSGDYAKSWTRKKDRARTGAEATVYNKHGWLTHLLEKGWTNTKTGARFEGAPHIGPTEEKTKQELLSRLLMRLSK